MKQSIDDIINDLEEMRTKIEDYNDSEQSPYLIDASNLLTEGLMLLDKYKTDR